LEKLQTDYIDILYEHWRYVPFDVVSLIAGTTQRRLRSSLIDLTIW